MGKIKLSNKFNLEDIHKLRVYNSGRWKNMTTKEMIADIKKDAEEFEKKVEELRENKRVMEK